MCFSPFRPLRSTKKCTKKGMQKVYKKLLAHPLFIRDYVVYYARVARTFILVSIGLAPVCVCVLHFYLD